MKIDTRKVTVCLAKNEMSRTDLAKECGISRQHLSTILSRGTCTEKTVGKLASGLNVSVESILPENGKNG